MMKQVHYKIIILLTVVGMMCLVGGELLNRTNGYDDKIDFLNWYYVQGGYKQVINEINDRSNIIINISDLNASGQLHERNINNITRQLYEATRNNGG